MSSYGMILNAEALTGWPAVIWPVVDEPAKDIGHQFNLDHPGIGPVLVLAGAPDLRLWSRRSCARDAGQGVRQPRAA